MPAGPNAELIGFREARTTGDAVAMVGPMTTPYHTYEYDPELGVVKVWLEHPEVPQPGAYDEAARILRARALERPVKGLRAWTNMTNFLANRLLGTRWEGIEYHGIDAGDNELQMILTYRPGMEEKWHLSVVPIRYGVLHDWEVGELVRAFGMQPPVRVQKGRTSTHFFWR